MAQGTPITEEMIRYKIRNGVELLDEENKFIKRNYEMFQTLKFRKKRKADKKWRMQKS